MSAKEYTAKSVEEALEKALNEMMLTREDIHYEIVQQPSKGFLGFGQKDAVVRVSKKDAAETKVEAVEVKAVKTEEKAEVKAEIPVQEPTPVVEVVVDDTEEQEVEVSFEEAFDTDIDEETEELDVAVAKADKKELYEAAEAKGRAFLAKIFDEMKLDVVIDVKENGGYLVFDLQGENLGILIGRRGDTLDSLQFLLNLVINDKNNAKVKGIIDIENYRAKREETLIGLGHKLAAKARKTGQKVVLEPMNPQERRIIHMALQNDKRVTTYSEGEEPYRKVVIEPVAGAEKPYYKKNYNKNYHNNKKRSYGKDAVKTTAQETETV
ncbi:MAG: protein jag [Peptococcaceae bacterium]|mgnify:FL=1|jgi:spoIIIJ-associated protein|nr:protein jag [Peptococcaceae bacterium]